MLWQHLFQVVVCVLSAVRRRTLQGTQDGSGGPKHVGANIRYFNLNFNILYV
jgi:hypothetical protein